MRSFIQVNTMLAQGIASLAQASRTLTVQLRQIVNNLITAGYETYRERLTVALQLDEEWEGLQEREREGFRGLDRLFRDIRRARGDHPSTSDSDT